MPWVRCPRLGQLHGREFIEECSWIKVCGRVKALMEQSQKRGVSTVTSRASEGAAWISVNAISVEGTGHLYFFINHTLDAPWPWARPSSYEQRATWALSASGRVGASNLQSSAIAWELGIKCINIHAWLWNFVETFLSCLEFVCVHMLGLSCVFG